MAATAKEDELKKVVIDTAKQNQKDKDFNLCKTIVEDVLGSYAPRRVSLADEAGIEKARLAQRVSLAGKAGIGKTRLAKMVGEYAVKTERCFLTICVHLNRKFVDELSLYENIASQLCVYSDFEETEVDERDEDEDEEKTPKEVLDDLKKKISEEIKRKREVADEKEKARKTANKNPPAVTTPIPGKNNANETEIQNNVGTGMPYLLLILDDEGIKVTNEDKEIIEAKENTEDSGTSGGNEITEDTGTSGEKVPSKEEVPSVAVVTSVAELTSEGRVMNDLNLQKFLDEQSFLKDEYRLKILVTKRKDEKPTESDKKTESEEGNNNDNESEGNNNDDNEIESEDNNNDDNEIEPEDNNNDDNGKEPEGNNNDDNGKESEGNNKGNNNNGNKSDGDTKSKDKGNPNPQPTDNTQLLKPDDDLSYVFPEIIKKDNLKELLESLITDEWKSDQEWITEMVENSKDSPAAIFVLAKSLKQIIPKPSGEKTIEEKRKKEEEIKEKIEKIKKKIKEVLSADRQVSSINPILHLAYVLLEYYDERLKEAILDCFWHSLDFFEHCGCVYYRDLITQWILEGYFDPVRSVEKAYQDGHSILMELINRGMLKIQENNVVVPERAMSNLIDPRRDGLYKKSRLRFSQVYRGDKKKGLGKITQIDDMIKTVQAKKSDKMTTILVGGDRLRRVTPRKYFAKLDGLEVLGMFEPTLEPFVPALITEMEKKERLNPLGQLRVLVIRDCDLLDDIEGLRVLRELQALEVSGASCLKKISPDFFKSVPKLQSLHLSGLQITSSPPSISELKKLHCLIIKDCPLLKDLPDIQELKELEVVDVSGAHGLQTCFDNTPGEKKNKSKNKNFYHLTKLQLLDFSESQIERLPIFQDSAEAKSLHSVTRLLLRNCSKLRRLPSLKPLSGLQILDLSGTTSLVEMLEVCFEDKKELKSLNLSGTNLSELATTIKDLTGLTKLLLKNCTNLEAIPEITPLENLEVIDVSGSTKLAKIEVSFEDMLYLREVNLSGTKVETPLLPNKSTILGLKCITLANGTYIEGKDWEEVKTKMPSQGSDKASSSGATVNDEEITEKEPEGASSSAAVATSEIQSNEPLTTVCTEKRHATKERLLQVPKDRTLYGKTLAFFKFASELETMEIIEINETNVVDEEALAKAEFVSFVDCSSTRLTSIFNKTKSVKRCWLRMCSDIKDLFPAAVEGVQPGVDVERLELLETLSITNLPLLESISCGVSLKNLKKLTVDCCPNIITLFPEASQVPSSLEDLHVKYCEKLEKVAEGVEPSSLTKLIVTKECCVNFKEDSVGPDWHVVHQSDIQSQG